MKLSLCITTYNRPELTIQAFEKVYSDPRIDEIVIVDDCSAIENYDMLHRLCDKIGTRNGIDKIKIHRNLNNLGMSRNKARAVELAKNDWCILFDSDNVLSKDYVDAFLKVLNGHDPVSNIIYCPDFARPQFDYRALTGKAFTPTMVGHEIGENNALNMAMNTCNYIVNKERYLHAYRYDETHIASDTVWFNYNWMLNGGCFYFVPGMQYFHRVHKDSGYMKDVNYNMHQSEQVKKLIMEL